MGLINFKLKDIEEIIPWGNEGQKSLHWFGLTDGEIWIDLGDTKLFEYTQESIKHFGFKSTRFNDYYIIRFIEDFSELFPQIGESLDNHFYSIAKKYKSLYDYYNEIESWYSNFEFDGHDEKFEDDIIDKHEMLVEWIYRRTLDSGHLIGGPEIGFYRKNDKISIVWKSDFTDDQVAYWTAQNGQLELDYEYFLTEIKFFADSFFKTMDKQVEKAIIKDWKDIYLDKEQLVKENEKRKLEFYSLYESLKQNKNVTDWEHIRNLYSQIITV